MVWAAHAAPHSGWPQWPRSHTTKATPTLACGRWAYAYRRLRQGARASPHTYLPTHAARRSTPSSMQASLRALTGATRYVHTQGLGGRATARSHRTAGARRSTLSAPIGQPRELARRPGSPLPRHTTPRPPTVANYWPRNRSDQGWRLPPSPVAPTAVPTRSYQALGPAGRRSRSQAPAT